MSRDDEHQRAAQILRATNTLARTMYRELVKADYSRDEVLRFVNKLLDLLAHDATRSPPDVTSWPATDAETGLPNAQACHEILDFECRRMNAAGAHRDLVVALLQVVAPPSSSGDARRRLKLRVVDVIRRSTRPADVLGRLGEGRYVLILPRTSMRAIEPITRRLVERLREESEPIPEATQVLLQFAAWRSGLSAAQLEEVAEQADAVDVLHRESGLMSFPGAANTDGLHLALGGGAGRALAHAGVIRTLLETGVPIRGIAGTSAGAMIGAMYAMGQRPDQIVARFEAFAESPLIREMRRAFVEQRRRRKATTDAERFFRRSNMAMTSEGWLSALDDELYGRFIEFFAGPDRKISSLSVPFSASATDLVHGRSVHLTHGSLHAALKATCAMPGLFPPQHQGDRILIDGFVLSEAPTDWIHRDAAPVPVLSVYLDAPPPEVETFENSVQLAIRASALVQSELAREQLRRAEILLSIPLEEFGWLAFRDARAIAELGATATKNELPRILSKLKPKA